MRNGTFVGTSTEDEANLFWGYFGFHSVENRGNFFGRRSYTNTARVYGPSLKIDFTSIQPCDSLCDTSALLAEIPIAGIRRSPVMSL
jgi:hypothetical protein